MARKLDKIIIVDLESTCWDGEKPYGMESDIIEIGVCFLDVNTGEITDNQGILVKPERSDISTFCTKLTTLTNELISVDGISFKESCNILRKNYLSGDRTWASFGGYDLKQFQRQCSAMDIKYPFGPSHINVKTLFALKRKLDREVGMSEALNMLNIPLEGIHHRGIDDAKNIAKILHWIFSN